MESVIRTIYLVRHGEKDNQTNDITAMGKLQSLQVGNELKNTCATFDTITSSNRARARQSAANILFSIANKKFDKDALLDEYYSREAEEGRMDQMFQKYISPATSYSSAASSNHIIVCHGNVISYIFTRILQMKERLKCVHNASISILRFDGTVKLLSHEIDKTEHLSALTITADRSIQHRYYSQ